jgi:hypothetical protein
MEHQIFEKIPELRIMLCRQCKHGVHPKEVATHLRKKHYLKTSDIQPIVQTVQQWNDIIQDPAAVDIPRELDDPLPILKVHTNGMQCQRDPGQCQYTTTHVKMMRKHWHQVHGWTQQTGMGRVPMEQQRQGAAEFQNSFRTVAWQQVFPTRKNSHLVASDHETPSQTRPQFR